MKIHDGKTPISTRLELLEDWIISRDADLLECHLAAGGIEGQSMRVIMRRSSVHPRADDECIELPFVFRWIFSQGLSDGARSVRYEIKRALQIEEAPPSIRRRRTGKEAA